MSTAVTKRAGDAALGLLNPGVRALWPRLAALVPALAPLCPDLVAATCRLGGALLRELGAVGGAWECPQSCPETALPPPTSHYYTSHMPLACTTLHGAPVGLLTLFASLLSTLWQTPT